MLLIRLTQRPHGKENVGNQGKESDATEQERDHHKDGTRRQGTDRKEIYSKIQGV